MKLSSNQTLGTDSNLNPSIAAGRSAFNNCACSKMALALLTFAVLAFCFSAQAQFVQKFRFEDSFIDSLAIQEDGKILLADIKGVTRLNPDGTLDPSFGPASPRISSHSVKVIAMEDDGGILLGGTVRSPSSAHPGLARLNPDGAWDLSIKLAAWVPNPELITIQPDGKSIVMLLHRVERHNLDGTVDTSFSCPLSEVTRVAPLPDGRILVATSYDHPGLARLNANGSLDASFVCDLAYPGPALVALPDGKILVGGGQFTFKSSSLVANGVVRLNENGSVDSSFQAAVPTNWFIRALVAQTDGKILFRNELGPFGGSTCTNVGRLNRDGSMDIPSIPLVSSNDLIDGLALQQDGTILLKGVVRIPIEGPGNSYHPEPYVAAFSNTGPATEHLSFDGQTTTWIRGGTGPEVWRTAFSVTTNGRDWTKLGDGQYLAGGWRLSGVSVPRQATIRARGYVLGSPFFYLPDSTCSWFIDAFIGYPVITRQPSSITNFAGTNVVFSAWGGGSDPSFIQWRKSGVDLQDGPNVSGAQSTVLKLSGILKGDSGEYQMVISNSLGVATSSVANLTVIEPFISAQPVSQEVNGGELVLLSVTAAGTPPLTYQWRKDGANIAGATTSSLSLSNVAAADVGTYDVIFGTAFGAVTSAPATLQVNLVVPDSWQPALREKRIWAPTAFAEQPDHLVLIGGSFASVNGRYASSFVRVTDAGATDTIFARAPFGAGYPQVQAIAVQADGKAIGGGLWSDSTVSGSYLARYDLNGMLEPSFNARPGRIDLLPYQLYVHGVVVLPDSKILVGGQFDTLAGQPCKNLGRLNPDGTLDDTFSPTGLAGGNAGCFAVQRDGKLLISGSNSNGLVRLHPNGDLDTSFHSPTPAGGEAGIFAIVVQPDGKILVGGSFTNLAGIARTNLARLNPDGTVDPDFAPFNYTSVTSIALQADGKIIVAPSIYPGPNMIRRFNADGTEDPTFLAFTDRSLATWVSALALESDGKLLAAGDFSRVAGQPRTNVARLFNTEPATETLDVQGSSITWLRGGTAPEVWRTTFEITTDALTWAELGSGERIPGGWRLAGVSLPQNCTIRARGHVTGGQYNGSNWYVESRKTLGSMPPVIQSASAVLGTESSRLRFKVSAPGGRRLVIESSTDMKQWTPVSTNSLQSDIFEFLDPDTATAPMKYYRARLH